MDAYLGRGSERQERYQGHGDNHKVSIAVQVNKASMWTGEYNK